MLPDPPRPYLSWYRPAVIERLIRVALLSAVVMTLGMALLGVALWSPRMLDGLRPFAAAIGGAATLAGPLSLVLRFHRLLMRDDGFLGVRLDGVEIRLDEPATFVAWDDLVGVSAPEGGAIELRLRSGEIVRVDQDFTGATRQAIARELETTRKRVGLGLIRG